MGYRANRDENDINNEDGNNEPSRFDKFASGVSNMRQGIKENGGLKGYAGNAIKGAINNKVDAAKDKAKNKINDKTNQLKGKINDKIPDSVKQKQAALKGKKDALSKKLNAPKDKIDQTKEKIDEAKKKLNETTFKKGVRVAADAVAPGTGAAAEKVLDTSVGKDAVEAARNASNPITALKEGTKKLVQIVVKKEITKKYVLPVAIGATVCMIIIILLTSVVKFGDSQNYKDSGMAGLDEFSEEYQKFYKNVEKYSDKYNADRYMVIAVLTAYKDNDIYTSDELGENEDVDPEEGDTPSASKKYIKQVAKAIGHSSNGIAEGDYVDRNSGSDFFWWLYDDFIDKYYEEYLGENLENKKREIIEFIYIYYEDIKEGDLNKFGYSSLCPGGITVIGGEYPGVYATEDYVAGVVKKEMGSYWNYPEVMKAFAIAARSFLAATGKCEIGNSENAQTFKPVESSNSTDQNYIKAANETSGMVLTRKDGSILQAQYVTIPVSKYITFDSNTNIYTYSMLHDSTDSASTYTYEMNGDDIVRIAQPAGGVYPPAESSGHHWGMLSYGAVYEAEQGKNYEQILNVFYGSNFSITRSGGGNLLSGDGILSQIIFPISEVNDDLYISAGYRGYMREDGTPHGAMDISCRAGGINCQKYQIIASYPGTVETITRELCNGRNEESAARTNIPYRKNCNGMGITVRVDSGPYIGYKISYWHFSSIDDSIQNGTKITMGQYLGQLGNTGNSTGPHLHFEIVDSHGNRLDLDSSIELVLPKPY